MKIPTLIGWDFFAYSPSETALSLASVHHPRYLVLGTFTAIFSLCSLFASRAFATHFSAFMRVCDRWVRKVSCLGAGDRERRIARFSSAASGSVALSIFRFRDTPGVAYSSGRDATGSGSILGNSLNATEPILSQAIAIVRQHQPWHWPFNCCTEAPKSARF